MSHTKCNRIIWNEISKKIKIWWAHAWYCSVISKMIIYILRVWYISQIRDTLTRIKFFNTLYFNKSTTHDGIKQIIEMSDTRCWKVSLSIIWDLRSVLIKIKNQFAFVYIYLHLNIFHYSFKKERYTYKYRVLSFFSYNEARYGIIIHFSVRL